MQIAEDKQNMLMNVLPRLFGERLLCWSVNAVSTLGYLSCWIGLIVNQNILKWISLFASDKSLHHCGWFVGSWSLMKTLLLPVCSIAITYAPISDLSLHNQFDELCTWYHGMLYNTQGEKTVIIQFPGLHIGLTFLVPVHMGSPKNFRKATSPNDECYR